LSELAGRWYDGQTSRGTPVVLSQPAAGRLRLVTDERTVELDIADLTISPRLAGTERQLHLPGLGQVEVPDSPLFDTWFPNQDRIEGFADWLERRRAAALGAAAATALGVIAFFTVGLPALAAFVAPHVPAAVERTMTEQVLVLFEKSGQLHPTRLSGQRQAELRLRFAKLVAGLERESQMRLEFRDAPGIGPNAFALPDGRVVFTDELVAFARSDEELVAVMAHEAGHHEHRHALRQALESSGVLAMMALLVGDVSGSSLTVSMPVLLLENGFSRGHEREADQFALDLLVKRGASPQAFADLLRRLGKEYHGDDGNSATSYLSTHPADADRIRMAEDAARKAR
jgi:Zn-dependent protease with chaperone function